MQSISRKVSLRAGLGTALCLMGLRYMYCVCVAGTNSLPYCHLNRTLYVGKVVYCIVTFCVFSNSTVWLLWCGCYCDISELEWCVHCSCVMLAVFLAISWIGSQCITSTLSYRM